MIQVNKTEDLIVELKYLHSLSKWTNVQMHRVKTLERVLKFRGIDLTTL